MAQRINIYGLGLFVKAAFVALSFQPVLPCRTSTASAVRAAILIWSSIQEGLEDTGHQMSFIQLTSVTPALPSVRHRQCKGQTAAPVWASAGRVGVGLNGPWRCDVHTRLSPFAGSYYLTTTYGVLEHIKNYDKITVTRQLSVEVQDSIHRWERRRTLNKARASRSSVQVAGIF